MAARSDFNSVFPRSLKRIWTLEKFDDAHQAGEAKRAMIEAHNYAKLARNKRQKMSVDASDSEE